MSDFLLELRSEEIPARMQDGARAELAKRFAAELIKAGLEAESIETYATPRRLALIARGLPAETAPVEEELKGPRASAPPQALEGFLRKTGLTREDLTERDGVLFAIRRAPGRATAAVLAEAIPAIIRGFSWPKSMRWGAVSSSTESLRWVRPLTGIVALFDGAIVECAVDGIAAGAETLGHRVHHPGVITLGGADDYVAKLHACHVIVDQKARKAIIREGAARLAAEAGLALIEDEGLVAENAGLTEWPVPLLGRFDEAFLQVPPEVIRLTMRTNQKYFALSFPPRAQRGEGDHQPQVDGGGVSTIAELPLHHSPEEANGPPPHALHGEEGLSPHFIAVANLEAPDNGALIAQGNAKVLAARLADARFFWEQDRKQTLAQHAEGLARIVFHEKLGTVADKVGRVAKLARWLVEEGIVTRSSPRSRGEGDHQPQVDGGGVSATAGLPLHHSPEEANGPPPHAVHGEDLATLAEQAARLCKADLTTAMVGEFPELQGVMGGHYARAEGLPAEVADAIRDHYKPVGQGDDVPTAPVTVAVALADKLDTIAAFFGIDEAPTGSRDPFALRRAALSVISIIQQGLRLNLGSALRRAALALHFQEVDRVNGGMSEYLRATKAHDEGRDDAAAPKLSFTLTGADAETAFFADRLKVQQREAGVRHDLIDAVFALGGEDDFVRLLARVKALQAFVETPDGANLLAGYKRAANILKKEGWGETAPLPLAGGAGGGGSEPGAHPDRPTPDPSRKREGDYTALDDKDGIPQTGEEDPFSMVEDLPELYAPPPEKPLSYTPPPEQQSLGRALDSAEPRAAAAIEAEDFQGAMRALATLRAPIDAFFDKVIVNDPDPAKRADRLALLARVRDAVHRVADFSKIEG